MSKIKENNRIFQIIIILISLSILSGIVSASGLEIVNKNYSLIKSDSDANKQFYNVFITVENQDSVVYDNITVELVDEWEIPTRQSYNFQPNEKKTFTFEKYPLAGGNIHQITVNIFPTNTSQTTSKNSATTTFNITYDVTAESDTPFLGIPIFISLLVFFGIVNKRKKY